MLLGAFLLQIIPLPGFVIWLRPSFVLLAILFWMFQAPGALSLTTVFFLGLLLDLLTGTLLGEHAFGLVALSYVALIWQRRWVTMPLVQQTSVIWVLVLLNKLCLALIQGFLGQWSANSLFWVASVIDAVLWIWIWLFFSEMVKKMRVER